MSQSGNDLPPVLKVVRLPDGRWAVENGAGVGDLTRDDVQQMADALALWFDIRWRMLPREDDSK